MALTNKGSKWEMKNSLVFIWSLFPILSCVTFFGMNSRVKNKKWSLLGWVSILLNMILILTFVISTVFTNPNERPNYYNVEPYPEIIDYMNSEQKRFYYENSSYESSTEFKLSKEYSNYQKAYDNWLNNEKKWKKQPDIVSKIEKYENFERNQFIVMISSLSAMFVIYVIFLIVALTDRAKYLRLLEQAENKSSIANRMNSVTKNIVQNTNDNKKEEIQSKKAEQTDINSASEEELSALQGLTIVDAKKAISYRNEHNGFNNVDEFFNCINAKPHIIVAIEKQLTVGEYKAVKPLKNDSPNKRMLDL